MCVADAAVPDPERVIQDQPLMTVRDGAENGFSRVPGRVRRRGNRRGEVGRRGGATL